MNLDNWLKILSALWDSGILTGVAVYVWSRLKISKKADRTSMLYHFADQAVYHASQFNEATTNEARKSAAMDMVSESLQRNKWAKRFTTAQISAAIEMAVNKMNGGIK